MLFYNFNLYLALSCTDEDPDLDFIEQKVYSQVLINSSCVSSNEGGSQEKERFKISLWLRLGSHVSPGLISIGSR